MTERSWSERGRVDNNRSGARQRGYDHKWDRAIREFKKHNPVCLGCWAIGVERKVDVVDHVVPHKGDQNLFWSIRNWQSACNWHHNAVKAELERRYLRKEISADDLLLTSEIAKQVTREKYRPAVGLDGFAIAGS